MGILTVAAVLVAALYLAQPAAAWSTGGWINARATMYGQDAWSLHEGSCGFGFVCPTSWSGQLKHGYDLVALSDRNPLFTGQRGSSCGQCLEVKCRDATVKDGFGESFDRNGMCLNSKSVKVKVADTCQCEYAPNAQSNKRWCCGDYPHLDMSQWALEKIAQDVEKWGVFGIQYRTIGCNDQIANEAPEPASIDADPHAGDRKAGEACAGTNGEGSGNSSGSSAGLATEGVSKARAQPRKAAPKPAPKSQPAPRRSAPAPRRTYVNGHSVKYWNRRKALLNARKGNPKPGFYTALTRFYAQFNPDMTMKNPKAKYIRRPKA